MKYILLILLIETSINVALNPSSDERDEIPEDVRRPQEIKNLSSIVLEGLDDKDELDDSTKKMFMANKVLAANGKCCVQIEMGEKSTHYAWNSNHFMVNGTTGHRYVTYWVAFPNPFSKVPDIALSLKQLDTSKHANTRVNATVYYKNTSGFILRIHTWADSKVYGATITYVARAYN